MGDGLTDDERQVLAAIGRRSPFPDALAAQVGAARVTARRWTGVGCYTDLGVPAEVPPLPDAGAACFGVSGRMGGRLCFFTLWLADDRRRVQFLEVCTPDADLPAGARLESVDGAPDAEPGAAPDPAGV